MKLKSEFYRLPLKFDAARLLNEIEQIPEEEWCPHPQGFKGNDALLLIAVNGNPRDDALKGPMLPTPHLQKCPYLQQVLASFKTIFGRTRLMRISGHSKVQKHMDANYYWHQRVRVHVPIQTTKKVRFHCGDHSVHMAAGESWIFDTWEQHMVDNPDDFTRIHLVADTVGSARFWDFVNLAGQPHLNKKAKQASQLIKYQPGLKLNIATETVNVPLVMSPWEQESVIKPIFDDMEQAKPAPKKDIKAILELTSRFKQRWKALWSRFGDKQQGFSAYEKAREQFLIALEPHIGKVLLPNGMDPISLIRQGVVEPSLNPDLINIIKNTPQTIKPVEKRSSSAPATQGFDRPIIIVAAPRSGSTLLFETLSKSPTVFTIGGESHSIIERIEKLNPENRQYESNQLSADDADLKTAQALRAGFFAQLHDRNGNAAKVLNYPVRMLEKTPKNALRIPFLNAVFPKAQFIYLYRNPRENISSIMDAWRSGRFVTYPDLPNWENDLKWSLLLTPDWQKLNNSAVEKIATEQWNKTHNMMLDALEKIPSDRVCAINYEEFIKSPQSEIEKICQFTGIKWDQNLDNGLALSKHTLSKPDPNKWKKNQKELTRILASTEKTNNRIKSFAKKIDQQLENKQIKSQINPQPKVDSNAPLSSVHTANLPKILDKYAFSILATTYQAGRLIVARPEGQRLNTHFHNFNKPMGMAVNNGRLAIGTKNEIRFYRNMPNVALKLEPKDKFDGCFLPTNSHVTGDIDIHEMNWVGNKLWFINTKFSCLCTLDDDHSFIPQWRPKFISALVPEDRCHLNGLCLVDGMPKYVTALGASDTPQGWRKNKAGGGVIIDIESGEIVSKGLSMPHSPRWYQGKLWVLESGNGSLATVDIKTGKLETVALLPGFTRGIDFAGDYAFIGLSQVRETAIFSGIPIAERLQQRLCGIWVVDIKTGQTAGFIKFEGAVEEIFSVSLLAGMRFPEILDASNKLVSHSYVLPTEALKDVPKFKQPSPSKITEKSNR